MQSPKPDFDYDVALSFAGEDRKYVQIVADALHELGVRVFYDRYEEVDTWGKDLYARLDEVYRKRAEYCVVFISKHYARKLWTNHERRSAQARALEEIKEYILPIRFDDTEVPGILPTIAYIDANRHRPSNIALLVAQKIGQDTDLQGVLMFLRDWLTDYVIEYEGTLISFQCEQENYNGYFSTRLLVEMYKENMLEEMFLMPGIVPH